MFDIKLIRENPELVKANIRKKAQKEKLRLVDDLAAKDKKFRALKLELDELRAKRNSLSQQINEAKKNKEDVGAVLEEAKLLPLKIKEKEEGFSLLQEEITASLKKIPNMMHKDVPVGKDSSENPELRRWGKIPKFDFEVKNHVELAEGLGLAEFDASAKTTGNGFYFLKGDLALLNLALIQLAVSHLAKKGYKYVEPPLMVHKNICDAAAGAILENYEKVIYKVEGDDLHLIPTSEFAVLGMHSEEAFEHTQLPLRYVAYSMCFRKEVGSHGINEKGLWRTHQFNKVEQFIFSPPNDSWKYFDELMKNSEELIQLLGLPYRVIECCTGDLGDWKARSFDLEVWRPTLGEYGEVGSLSNCTDYQARDLNIKVINKDGSREVLHTLNNTAIATSRVMVAILENYQQKDGSILVPKVLQPFLQKEKIVPTKK
ncbi:serine--tRNA ligase [Candidatus Woesearchaeota archaeon]|nr:serine--tRNA ligase [Candidatus Woesearchaeota archaeon]